MWPSFDFDFGRSASQKKLVVGSGGIDGEGTSAVFATGLTRPWAAVRFLPSKYRRDPVSAVQTGDLPLSSIGQRKPPSRAFHDDLLCQLWTNNHWLSAKRGITYLENLLLICY